LVFLKGDLSSTACNLNVQLAKSLTNDAEKQDTVGKFAICFLPFSVTAGWQPSQAAAAGCLFCCCREKSVVRVGSISAGNFNSFDPWWIGKVV
jgi:hypothetical protein